MYTLRLVDIHLLVGRYTFYLVYIIGHYSWHAKYKFVFNLISSVWLPGTVRVDPVFAALHGERTAEAAAPAQRRRHAVVGLVPPGVLHQG